MQAARSSEGRPAAERCGGSFARAALRVDSAAVLADGRVGDGQPEARAGGLGREQRFEDVGQVRLADTRPFIADSEVDPGIAGAGDAVTGSLAGLRFRSGDGDHTASLHGVAGIDDEIDHGLAEQPGIAFDAEAVRRDVEDEAHRRDHRLQFVPHRGQPRAEIQRLQSRLGGPGEAHDLLGHAAAALHGDGDLLDGTVDRGIVAAAAQEIGNGWMAMSTLLNSWAMPAARRPRLVMRADCCN